MDKPVGLQGFPEGFRLVGRHLAADGRHLAQLFAPFGIGRFGGQMAERLCVTPGKGNQGIGRNVHSLQLLLLVQGPRVPVKIQCGKHLGNLLFELQKPLAVDDIPQRRVPGGTLLLELREDAGFIGRFPGSRQLGKHAVTHGVPLPEGDDLFGVDLPHCLIGGIGDLGALVQQLKVFEAVQADLRIGGRGFGGRPPFPHDQLPRRNADLFVFHQMLKDFGPPDRYGIPFQAAALEQPGH